MGGGGEEDRKNGNPLLSKYGKYRNMVGANREAGMIQWRNVSMAT